MKKILIIIIVIAALSFSGCDAVLQALQEYDNSQTTTSSQQAAEDTDAPALPDIDFSQTDLFEDGYQIVEFDHAPDGDTAIFIVDGSYIKTRFLGVDTTEMSTDSGVPEPWAEQAKEFTNDMLNNANQIILELDDSDTFDDYDRLLAWIWVDGKLLNFMLAQTGFADVKYLYDDYKYNDYLLDAEYAAQNQGLGIWGNDEPYYNPDNNYTLQTDSSADSDYISIKAARSMAAGTTVQIRGTITAKIGYNAFIQDETAGIYVFTNNKKFNSLDAGNEISIRATLQDYNGLLELVDFNDSDIIVLSENNTVSPKTITLIELSDNIEGQYVKIQNAEITYVDYTSGERGYSVFITQNGTVGEIRVDKYLGSYPEPSYFTVGSIVNITGNVAQHYDSIQIMISGTEDIEIIK